MKLWLIYQEEEAEKNKQYIHMYEEACAARGIAMELVTTTQLVTGFLGGISACVRRTKPDDLLPDIVINRTRDAFLGKQLELLGCAVYNNSQVTEICNDKAKTHQYLSSFQIPMMDSWYFTKGSDPTVFCGSYPLVVKSAAGHGGSEVFLVQNEEELLAAVAGISSGRIVVQRPASEPGKDLRVYVIGKEIVAGVLRTSEDDFRSNYSLGGKVQLYSLSEEERALVERVTGAFSFGLVGIDFLFHNGQLVLNEIEDMVGARMLYRLTDIPLVERYLDFILKDVSGKGVS